MPSFNMNNYCTPERLGHELNSDENVLLIDCRPQTEFARSNIVGAINVALPSLMLRRLKKGNLNISCIIPNNEGKERFKKYYKSHLVILYDECSTEINSNPSSIISLLLKRLGQDGCDACFLLGGFSTFEDRYPEYCFGNSDQEDSTIVGLKNLQISDDSSYGTSESDSGTPPHLASTFPVEVISYLYLGNAKNSADKEQLKKYGIKYILNVTPNVPNMYENDENFKYMQIPINDHWSQNLGVFFPDAIAFIDEARKNHCGVLVHCLAGISRSVTVTVAYLMQKFALKLNDAYDMVKKCKPNISPNFNFMGQLLDFERILDQNQNNIGKCSCESSLVCHCRDSNLIDNVSKDSSQTYQLDIRPA